MKKKFKKKCSDQMTFKQFARKQLNVVNVFLIKLIKTMASP